jgi:hypothetical protein
MPISRVRFETGHFVRAKLEGDATRRTTKSTVPRRSQSRALVALRLCTAHEFTVVRGVRQLVRSADSWARVRGDTRGSTTRVLNWPASATSCLWAAGFQALRCTTSVLTPTRRSSPKSPADSFVAVPAGS